VLESVNILLIVYGIADRTRYYFLASYFCQWLRCELSPQPNDFIRFLF